MVELINSDAAVLDALVTCDETETKRQFPVEACWLSQTKVGQTEQIHAHTFDDPVFFVVFFFTAFAWSTCTGFPLDIQSTRNTMLRFSGISGRDSVGRGQHSSNRVSGISTRTMHEPTTPFLSQTIWPRWASRQFLSQPIVPTLLPVTFRYSLSSEAVVRRQLRRWKRLWRRLLTRSHKRLPWSLPEVVGTVQVHCSRRRLLRRGLDFNVCTINKSARTKKKFGNLFNEPCIYI